MYQTASMTDTKTKLRALVEDLSRFADQYDENDVGQRFALRSKANQIATLGTKGLDVALTHSINVG